MVVQLGRDIWLGNADAALLDGERATLELDPPASHLADFETRRAAYVHDNAQAQLLLAGPPVAWRLV